MQKAIIYVLTAILALMPAMVHAQNSGLPYIVEIATVENDNLGAVTSQLMDIPKGDEHNYYICLGQMGFGNDIVQINLDPFFFLFIPLGNTIEEARATMEEMQKLYKSPSLTTSETQGCLAVGFPVEELETVTLTHRKAFLSNTLEFSIERDGYLRVTYLNKSDFNSLLNGLKFYKKLHPKLQ